MSVPIDNDVTDLRARRLLKRIRLSAAAACTAALVLGVVAFSDAFAVVPLAAHSHRSSTLASSGFAPDPYPRHLVMANAVFVPSPRPAPHVALIPSADGISSVALTAYERAAQREQKVNASCRIPWQLVAAIGYIESDDGQFGADHLLKSGKEAAPLLGIPLDGSPGVALILDAHGHYARAEGPMQFIPSTWSTWQADGNGDRKMDPQNIFDASAAAADYLCSGTGDLSSLPNQPAAITHYNDSPIYVKNVMNVEHAYVVGLPAPTVKLIPMPTTPTCPKGKKAKRGHGPKVCVAAASKKTRDVDATTVRAPVGTPAPSSSPAPDPDPTTPAPNPVTPSPSPSVTPSPSSSGPPTPTASQ
jgi:hypothetical protein